MSFDDRGFRRDDSPKSRVQAKFPQYKCVKILDKGFVITDGKKHLCEDNSAYEAWRLAESMLIISPEREKRRQQKLAEKESQSKSGWK